MHLYNRLSSPLAYERERIDTLLNLADHTIAHGDRESELKAIIKNNLLVETAKINTEADVLNYLKNRITLNDVPLAVKKYFNLAID
ncbi:hypothetical protein D9M68_979020 [compost metagenome]